MNLLLVDDDILILKDLQQKIDWAKLGFEKVFTATQAEEALTIFGQVPVHVMLCDIEMPGKSGLDLLERLQDEAARPVCIVLTSYARFDYARRAVQLGALEYLLKPVAQPELEETLRRACLRVQEQLQTAKTELYGQFWIDERKNTSEYFWQRAALGKLGQLNGIPEKLGYREDDLFTPVAVEFFPGEALSQWDADMFEYALKNVLYELLCDEFLTPESVTALGENLWLAVVRVQQTLAPDTTPLLEKLNELMEVGARHLSTPLCCGVGAAARYADMESAVKAVLAMMEGTFNRSGAILSVEDYKPAQPQFYTIPEIGIWETLLKNGEHDALLAQVRSYVREQADQSWMTTTMALAFRQDIAQMVYTFLKQHEIHAHRLYADADSDALYQNACRSPESMVAYCDRLITRALDYTSFSKSSQSVVQTLTAYLDAHFSEEVTRGDLADIVYISPDYLSRLFKKETGKSLVQYITDKRMDYACRLLKESEAPINGIAMQAGFSNFAYFSKVFRESTGCTPMEYRKGVAIKKKSK